MDDSTMQDTTKESHLTLPGETDLIDVPKPPPTKYNLITTPQSLSIGCAMQNIEELWIAE